MRRGHAGDAAGKRVGSRTRERTPTWPDGRPPAARVISVLLVDDLPAVRQGLRMRLSLESDLRVVGEAADGAEAVDLARRLHPDVVLMDLEMPGMDGLTATAVLAGRVPRSAVVTLSLHDDRATRARASQAGARAFVAKHEPVEALLAAIRGAGRVPGPSGGAHDA